MTRKLKRLSIFPSAVRWIALALLSACAAPAVLAEGVVVKSTSAEHPVGSVVADGEQLRLAQGQSITVLDRSGVVVVRVAGRYAGPTSSESSGFLEIARSMAEGPRAKAAIGGTRTVEEELAQKCAAAGGAKPGNACIAPKPISRPLRVTSYVPASKKKPAQLMLVSGFNGVAICTAWNGNQDSVFLPGADPQHPLLLKAAEPSRLAAPKGVAKSAIRAATGLRSVDCAAVSVETWQALQIAAPTALTPNATAVILSAFARMQGDTAAEARFTAKPAKPAPRKAPGRKTKRG